MGFKSYTLLIGLFSVAAAAPERSEERIINGKSIDIQEVPWQIALLSNSERNCGGSILSDRIILTAAHCLEGRLPSELTVRAGSSYLEHGGQLLHVEDFKIHEAFNVATNALYNDVGVVRLSEPLIFGPRVRPINLAQQNPKNGESALVCGWGTQMSGLAWYPEDLQGVHVGILDRQTCLETSKYSPIQLEDDVFCAVSPGKDSCGGDSGGPVAVNGVQVGIVSWGTGCAHPKFPGVYASVAHFYDWIHDAIKDLENRQ